MFSMLMISLREGIEAFLIVALTLAYLRKTGREQLVSAVFWGTGLAVVASFVAMLFFREAENKPLWEGILAAAAAMSVLSLTIYMFKNAKKIRGEIASKVEAAALKTGNGAWAGVFAFVLFMIVREGMETALIISSLASQTDSRDMFAGALMGVAGAALVAWAWGRYGHRVNIARFLQVTSLFLVLFVVQLFIYAFHEFSEAGVLPGMNNEYWHLASEPYGPEGQYGQWLSYCMVLVPLAWLVFAWAKDRTARMNSRESAPARKLAVTDS
ncbi:MAG: FTR1 family protein [Usitatibacteraceae bacterium]